MHHVDSSSKKATRHNSSLSPSVCSGINYIPFPGNRNPYAGSYIITLSGGCMYITYEERLENEAATHAQMPYMHSQTMGPLPQVFIAMEQWNLFSSRKGSQSHFHRSPLRPLTSFQPLLEAFCLRQMWVWV